MPLNSKKHSLPPSDELKHMYFKQEDAAAPGIEYFPFFFAEARIDFNDVRTGLRETVSLSKALEIYSNSADLLWTEDMIRDVDPKDISTSLPENVHLCSLPDFVDANFVSQMEVQFTQYLLRSFVARVYRNYNLNVYSFSGETRSEFADRCLELLDGPRRKDLDLLHDVFKRRLEQIKERHLLMDEPAVLELAKTESQRKNIFSKYSDQIADFFMRGEFRSESDSGAFRNSKAMTELEEKLVALEMEARQAITRLRDSYEEQAQALDEYVLHPNPKDIHFVRSCILWMPKKAA
jgi:hypothetical protein